MGGKKSLVLALAAVLIVAYIVLFEMSGREMPKTGFIFPDLHGEEIKSITVENVQGEFTIVNPNPKKIDVSGDVEVDPHVYSKWYISELPTARLSEELISNLVNEILQVQAEDPFVPNQDLSIYGLDDPRLRVTIKTLLGDHTIEVGERSEYLGSYFARLDGKELFMLNARLAKLDSRDADNFRDYRIIANEADSIYAVTIRRGFHEVVLKRDADGWNIHQPDFFLGDENAVNELISSLLNLTSQQFFDLRYEQLSSAGLDNPILVIELHSTMGDKVLKLSDAPKEGENIFVYVEGEHFFSLLSRASLKQLPLSIYALRKKNFVDFEEKDIVTCIIEKEDNLPIFIEKKKGTWLVNGQQGDRPFIERFFANLKNMRAEDFPDYNEQIDFQKPRLRIVLRKKDASELVILVADKVKTAAKNSFQYYYVMGAATSEPYLISENTYRAISPVAEALYITVPIQEE